MGVRIAYGNKDAISPAINSRIIPNDCIIIVKDSDEILFYNADGILKTLVSKSQFNHIEEAETWINQNNCVGQAFTVYDDENEKWESYVVQNNNTLQVVGENVTIYEFDSHLEFPNVGQKDKLYIATNENDGNGILYRWDVNKNTYFSLTEPSTLEIDIIDCGDAFE